MLVTVLEEETTQKQILFINAIEVSAKCHCHTHTHTYSMEEGAMNSLERAEQIKENFRVRNTLDVERQIGVCKAVEGRAAQAEEPDRQRQGCGNVYRLVSDSGKSGEARV